MTELAEDDVKLTIMERETFGVTLNPLRESELGYSGILTRNIEQSRRQVEPRHRCSRPRCRDRNDTGASSDVEYRFAGPDFCELDEMCRGRRRQDSGRRKRRPHFALACL
jgi:hypothetical protein